MVGSIAITRANRKLQTAYQIKCAAQEGESSVLWGHDASQQSPREGIADFKGGCDFLLQHLLKGPRCSSVHLSHLHYHYVRFSLAKFFPEQFEIQAS